MSIPAYSAVLSGSGRSVGDDEFDILTVYVRRDKADELVAGYDPNSATSPSAALSREAARPIAEALATRG